jgi:hypothetical protein
MVSHNDADPSHNPFILKVKLRKGYPLQESGAYRSYFVLEHI